MMSDRTKLVNGERVTLTPDEIAEIEAREAGFNDPAAALARARALMVVTPRQARLVLLQAGHLDAVETMLALPENKAAQITWEYALEIKRSDPLITAIGGALGLTEAEIDAMFEAAKSL